ncbi:Gypsy retrotransposon integrase-like protein 1, partial [Mucuna pruriens]
MESESRPNWTSGSCASNLLGNGIRVVLASPKGQYFPFLARLGFDYTNNMAEYEACTMGITMAIEHHVKTLTVFGDSTLVIYQLREEWEMRDTKLIHYHNHIMEMSEHFNKITFLFVPQDDNQMADALATLSAMLQVNRGQEITIHVRQQVRMEHFQHLDQNKTENDKRTLRRLVTGFFLSKAILYKRGKDPTLLCWVADWEVKKIMKEVHEGAFETHTNNHALARKILRVGYYWTQMESDYCQYVKRCMKCQIYADNIHVAPSTLHNLATPWSFSMWGLDMIGPIETKVSNKHRFILVAIEYFTKWVEVASYASVTRSIVYDLPAHIITDNGTNLNNKMMTELCVQFKIKHHNSMPYHPKMNGVVEEANKNIKKIVQKMVVTYKDWHDMLPYALHGYRTSIRTSTGETPYSLVYGIEAVLLVEVEIPFLRVLAEIELSDAE